MDQKYKLLQQHSNFTKANKIARRIYGQPLSVSTRKFKKYMIKDPFTNKYIHFGDIRYEDFLFHKNPNRRDSYLKRSAEINGPWKKDEYSPNNLSRRILWVEGYT
jgi:hypothetical protein